MNRFKLLIALFVLLSILNVQAWDAIGHRAIASIAQKHLNKKTQKKLDNLLGKNGIIYVSTWADEARNEDRYKKYSPWHYQNLSSQMSNAELLNLVDHPDKDGEHLFYAIQHLKKVLNRQPNDTTALKLLIHFMGDIGQPMHLGHLEDLGGNQVKIKWFGDQISLHSLWDTYMIESMKMSYSEISDYLCDKFEFKSPEAESDFKVNILRTYSLCHDIYDYDYTIRNQYAYIHKFVGRMELQLYFSGLELAKILNEIYSTH